MFIRNNRNIKLGVVYRFGDYQTSKPEEELTDGRPNWFYYSDNSENVHNDGSDYPGLRFQAGIWNPQKVVNNGVERVPAIICSTSLHQAGSAETPWTDVIEHSKREATYYGDNKPPANPDASLVRGNSEMLRAFKLHHSKLEEDRSNAPPILLISTRDENGPRSGYKVLEGLCLIESYKLIEQDTPEATFANYEFRLKLLDMESCNGLLEMDWIHARRDPNISNKEANRFAPDCWKEFISKGIEKSNMEKSQGNSLQKSFEIDIRPETSALKLFKSMDFTPWYALGEFVDNSITSAIKNIDLLKSHYGSDYRLVIDINFDVESNSLTISDNAAGISKNDFERSMRTSEPPPDTSVGLGLHGVGMKASAFWWGESLEVKTYPVDELTGWEVCIDLSELDKTGNIQVLPIDHTGKPGTQIKVAGLWNGVPRYKTPSTIKKYLSSIYRSYIASESKEQIGWEIELRFQGEVLAYKAPDLLIAPFWPDQDGPKNGSEEIIWREEIEIELSSGQKILGWVGILNRMSRDMSGFFLHYRGKGVAGVTPTSADGEKKDMEISREGGYKPHKIFGQSGSYADQSFIGEFDVSEFGKTITTDSVMWTNEEETEFIEQLSKLMKNPLKDFFRQSQNMRRRKLPKSDAEKEQINAQSITAQISTHLGQLGVSHQVIKSSEKVELPEGLDLEDKSIAFNISDEEGHFHQFELIVISERDTPLISLIEDVKSSMHKIVLNKNHVAFDSFPPLQGELRRMLLLICISIRVAEVFLEGPERDRLRLKFNEIIAKYGSEIN
jgi:hypothetical protein